MKNYTKNYLLLISIICAILLLDRLLLLWLGLPLWEWDEKLHYKHRKNITKIWESYGDKLIKINEFGQHDDSFQIKKRKNEFRILNLGDSITMGHGVSRDETYSKYLELILADSLRDYESVQVINTGVQGYSTFQELEMLKRSMIFDPDIITIGFCLNDVTEPFVVNKDLGGIGLDYHRVTQAPNAFLSYLLNETGFGRLIQEFRIKKLDAKQEKIAELFEVNRMLSQRNGTEYKAQWDFTLKELSKLYQFCKRTNIPLILIIFPYTIQFTENNLSWPQQLLINHAVENDVIFLDLLPVFKDIITLNPEVVSKYFLDEDHFTPLGHKYVAEKLSKTIIKYIREKR